MDSNAGHAKKQDHELYGTQSRFVTRIGQLEEQQSAQHDQQTPFVPIRCQGVPHDGIEWSNAHDHQVEHQVDMRRQVRHELDDWHLVVFVAERQCEYHPHWWTHDESD